MAEFESANSNRVLNITARATDSRSTSLQPAIRQPIYSIRSEREDFEDWNVTSGNQEITPIVHSTTVPDSLVDWDPENFSWQQARTAPSRVGTTSASLATAFAALREDDGPRLVPPEDPEILLEWERMIDAGLNELDDDPPLNDSRNIFSSITSSNRESTVYNNRNETLGQPELLTVIPENQHNPRPDSIQQSGQSDIQIGFPVPTRRAVSSLEAEPDSSVVPMSPPLPFTPQTQNSHTLQISSATTCLNDTQTRTNNLQSTITEQSMTSNDESFFDRCCRVDKAIYKNRSKLLSMSEFITKEYVLKTPIETMLQNFEWLTEIPSEPAELLAKKLRNIANVPE